MTCTHERVNGSVEVGRVIGGMAKFRIEMREILAKPYNPFKIGRINECARRREAVIEAESEQAVREFFDDAKRRDFDSVRGFELVKVEQQS